jgi:cell division protein FtsA
VTLVPDRAVLGLPGSVVHAVNMPAKIQRPRPDERVRPEELDTLTERALRLARAQAEQAGPVELVQQEPLHFAVDGHRASDVSRLRGQELGLTLFAAFIPQTQAQALQRLQRRLELDVVATVAGPFALASIQHEDGLLIDLGGLSTDLALVRDGQLAATGHMPSGGASFDRELARRLEMTPARAELIKFSYQAGQLDERTAQEIASICQREAVFWLESLLPLVARFSDTRPLPANVWLCGGGSDLSEVFRVCRDFPWMQRFAFERYPQARRLEPADLPLVLDRTGGKLTMQDVPALALAQMTLARMV